MYFFFVKNVTHSRKEYKILSVGKHFFFSWKTPFSPQENKPAVPPLPSKVPKMGRQCNLG